MRKLIWLASVLLAGAVLYGVAGEVQASRNSSGTYSLAAGNPVTTLQTIGSGLWNNTFNDLAADMTLSLDRNGRGGMLAALRGIDGTVAAPALSFTSETGSGLFRNGAGDVRMSILGSAKTFWSATGLGVGAAPSRLLHIQKTGASGATSGANTTVLIESNGAHDALALLAPNANSEAIVFGDVASAVRGAISYFNSTNASADQMQFTTGGSLRTTISNSGLTIGSSGTAISGSFRGSSSLTPGSIPANSCATLTALTVTGAAAGSECALAVASTSGVFSFYCVAGSNNCIPVACNVTTGAATPASGTYACRVFNP